MSLQGLAVIFVVLGLALDAEFTIIKRGIIHNDPSSSASWADFNLFNNNGGGGYPSPNGLVELFHPSAHNSNNHNNNNKQNIYSPSTGEIAAAIQAAKEASASVAAAQRRVQEAKEDVLNQQHISSHKQAQAALALQKTEAAAAVQQQEAKSAATVLVQAQQRLGQAKAHVAELQRLAAAKEAQAAHIIQKSAAAAAAEIQRSDAASKKLSALHHSTSDSIRQAAAVKEATLTATSAAVAASVARSGADHQHPFPHYQSNPSGPWVSVPNFLHVHPWG